MLEKETNEAILVILSARASDTLIRSELLIVIFTGQMGWVFVLEKKRGSTF